MLVFPQREIPPHARPVTPAELVVGEIYFQAVFVDNEMLVPELRPLAYLGWDLRAHKRGRYAFQDASSYLAGKTLADSIPEDPVRVDLFEVGGLGGVYTFEFAVEVLLRCSLRRIKASAQEGNPLQRRWLSG